MVVVNNEANHAPTALHLVPTADRAAIGNCLARCRAGDSVLLLCDGVLHLSDSEGVSALPERVALYAIRADLPARGLPESLAAETCRLVEDAGFPGLLERHSHCLTWK